MDLTIQECQFLLNAINAYSKAGFADGLVGVVQAKEMALKLQQHASILNLAAPQVVAEVEDEDEPKEAAE